ncbi:MAG: hypothetical protein ACFFD2_08050 [Promethearchaeota archaeon]
MDNEKFNMEESDELYSPIYIKYILEESKSWDEIIKRLENFIKEIKEIKDDGYLLNYVDGGFIHFYKEP